MKELKEWTVTDSEYIVHDKWLKLRAETCITPDGHTIAPYYVFEYNDWVNCLVISDEGEVTVLRHYRQGIRDTVLEIVAGGVDDGEQPDEAIRRELEEEVGLSGATIHKVGECYANPSNQTNKTHLYVALGGTFDGKKYNEPGADFEIITMPLDEFLEKIYDHSELFQSLHLASVLMALNYLKKHNLFSQ